MEVAYTIRIDENSNIGAAIPADPASTRNNLAPPALTVKHIAKTRTVEVRKCKSTSVDETLHTVDEFLIERETSKMSWSEAIYNFSHCLGNTA